MPETTHPAVEEPFDAIEFVIAFEGGELFEEDVIAGFQHLVNSGLAWRLQGAYGRLATALIEAGEIHLPEPESHLPEGYTPVQVVQDWHNEPRLDAQTEADALAAHLTRIAF